MPGNQLAEMEERRQELIGSHIVWNVSILVQKFVCSDLVSSV